MKIHWYLIPWIWTCISCIFSPCRVLGYIIHISASPPCMQLTGPPSYHKHQNNFIIYQYKNIGCARYYFVRNQFWWQYNTICKYYGVFYPVLLVLARIDGLILNKSFICSFMCHAFIHCRRKQNLPIIEWLKIKLWVVVFQSLWLAVRYLPALWLIVQLESCFMTLDKFMRCNL